MRLNELYYTIEQYCKYVSFITVTRVYGIDIWLYYILRSKNEVTIFSASDK